MVIHCMENNTKVHTPDGHTGRLRVTRRERKLIDSGKIVDVTVVGTDGLHRGFSYAALVKVVDTPEVECPCCGRPY